MTALPVQERTNAPEPIGVHVQSLRVVSGDKDGDVQKGHQSSEQTKTTSASAVLPSEDERGEETAKPSTPSLEQTDRGTENSSPDHSSTQPIPDKSNTDLTTSHTDRDPSDLLTAYHNRGDFSPLKDDSHLRSQRYPEPAKPTDELCSGELPNPIPALTPALQNLIDELLRVDPATLNRGQFEFSIPPELHNDYHYLSESRAKHLRDSFCFAWGNYRERAWGADEIHPVDGTPGRDWGGIGMTLLDSIDTLKILGLEKDFELAKEWVGMNELYLQK